MSTDSIVPTQSDVLSGRGHGIASHPGNESFRSLVKKHKSFYRALERHEKIPFCEKIIVDEIENTNPPGRFLYKDESGRWRKLPREKALLKISQALRDRPLHERKERLRAAQQQMKDQQEQLIAAAQKNDQLNVRGGENIEIKDRAQSSIPENGRAEEVKPVFQEESAPQVEASSVFNQVISQQNLTNTAANSLFAAGIHHPGSVPAHLPPISFLRPRYIYLHPLIPVFPLNRAAQTSHLLHSPQGFVPNSNQTHLLSLSPLFRASLSGYGEQNFWCNSARDISGARHDRQMMPILLSTPGAPAVQPIINSSSAARTDGISNTEISPDTTPSAFSSSRQVTVARAASIPDPTTSTNMAAASKIHAP